MKLKSTVVPTDSKEVWFAAGVYEGIRQALNLGEGTITAMRDGHHNVGSLHPTGLAADLRTKDMPEATRWGVFATMRTALEPQGFDVTWEGGVGATPETTGAHIHVEFQPKQGEKFLHPEGE